MQLLDLRVIGLSPIHWVWRSLKKERKKGKEKRIEERKEREGREKKERKGKRICKESSTHKMVPWLNKRTRSVISKNHLTKVLVTIFNLFLIL